MVVVDIFVGIDVVVEVTFASFVVVFSQNKFLDVSLSSVMFIIWKSVVREFVVVVVLLLVVAVEVIRMMFLIVIVLGVWLVVVPAVVGCM